MPRWYREIEGGAKRQKSYSVGCCDAINRRYPRSALFHLLVCYETTPDDFRSKSFNDGMVTAARYVRYLALK